MKINTKALFWLAPKAVAQFCEGWSKNPVTRAQATVSQVHLSPLELARSIIRDCLGPNKETREAVIAVYNDFFIDFRLSEHEIKQIKVALKKELEASKTRNHSHIYNYLLDELNLDPWKHH